MYDFISGVLCGERPGFVVAIVVAMIVMAEVLRYTTIEMFAYAKTLREMKQIGLMETILREARVRLRWAHGFFRLAPLLLMLLVHRQTVEVTELKQIVEGSNHATVMATKVASATPAVEYEIVLSTGTRVSWTAPDSGGVRSMSVVPGRGSAIRHRSDDGSAIVSGQSRSPEAVRNRAQRRHDANGIDSVTGQAF